jgi:vancomycin resistance protein YoaR
MGRPTTVTQEMVSLTAEKLIAENKSCTLIDVHKIIGGSLSTVSKYWKKWRETKGHEVVKKPVGKEPGADLNSFFLAEVNRQISEMHENYEAKFREKDEENEYLRENLAKLETDAKLLSDQNTIMKEQTSFIAGEKASLETRQKTLEEKLEKTLEELSKVNQKIAFMKGALEEAKNFQNTTLEEILSLIKS